MPELLLLGCSDPGDPATQQASGIPHDPPGMRLLYSLSAMSLQPGYFGGQVVGIFPVVIGSTYPATGPFDEGVINRHIGPVIAWMVSGVFVIGELVPNCLLLIAATRAVLR